MVSVIMPAYNCADTISTAIDSVLIQDVPLELIIINDCSREDLDAVLDPYLCLPQIQYIKNEKNMGAAASRNKGVRMAEGEYIAFLDSDDWWEAGKLSAQIALMERENVVLSCTARELVTPEGELTGRVIHVGREISYRSILHHNCINCSSVVVKKEAALKYPMEHEDSHEDYITWIKILKEYKRALAIDHPYLKYRLSNSGKSGNKFKSARMTYTVYRYSGFSPLRSAVLFCMYAVNGVLKYGKAYLNKEK